MVPFPLPIFLHAQLHPSVCPSLKEIRHAMSSALLRLTKLLLSRFSCPFFPRKAPSCWLPLDHKAHQSTSIAFHFDKDLIRIFVYMLLIIMESLPGRAHLAAHFLHIAANCNLRDDIFIKKWVRDSSCLHQV